MSASRDIGSGNPVNKDQLREIYKAIECRGQLEFAELMQWLPVGPYLRTGTRGAGDDPQTIVSARATIDTGSATAAEIPFGTRQAQQILAEP